MGVRSRQSFQIFPGVRLNFGLHGVSASIGIPGASINVSSRGIRATTGIPGTGLSFSQNIHSFGGNGRNSQGAISPDVVELPIPAYEIKSAPVESLTSKGLESLRDLIATAKAQQRQVRYDLKLARSEELWQKTKLDKRRKSIFRSLYKKSIIKLTDSLPIVSAEVARLEEWEMNTRVNIQFNVDERCKRLHEELTKAFTNLSRCSCIWDITTESQVDQFRERSFASLAITRKQVNIDLVSNDLIHFEAGNAMRFENANGTDILLYPGIALMPVSEEVFALLDLRELEINFTPKKFVENEAIPSDGEVIGHTWAKVNKDGSPDRRFRENYQIPVCRYGELSITSKTGLCEQYHFSQAEPLRLFCEVFRPYRAALQAASTDQI